MRSRKQILAATVGLAAITAPSVVASAASPVNKQQPNIIFILVDDLGKEWIECYGGKDVTLPNINALAEQGIRFDNAYSMPQSTPPRVALITGQYPYNNGWVNHFDVPRWGYGANFDPEQNPCMARQIREQGYATCAAGKWQLNDFRLQPDIMNTLGFDEYCMWTGCEGGNEAISLSRYWSPYIHTKEGSKQYKGEFGPDIYNDYVLNFMRENCEKPMYVYYPMALTHGPLVATPHDKNASTKYEKHVAMVKYADYLVGKIMAEVKALGIEDNTYIIFTTDNGTASSIIGRRDQYYIRGGKAFLSENGINAPFIVKSPHQKGGTASDALVDFTDIYPTVMELIGAKKEIDKRVDGVSFASVLTKGGAGKRDWAMSMGCNPAHLDDNMMVKNVFPFRDRAIIGREYKIYLSTERKIERIYKIEEDPYELEDLVGDKAVFDKVSAIFAKLIASLPETDANPKYTKLNGSLHDVAVKTLNNAAVKTENYSGIESEENYLKFKD